MSAPDFAPACPLPLADYPRVLLAHGGGGTLMHQLIEKIFMAAFANETLAARHDGAVVALDGEGGAAGAGRAAGARRLAFTTDSYVIRPLFFPGGDIGSLAVHGTVNDLAMCGARARHLSAGFIIEEGLEIETLWRIALSMRRAADAAGAAIVTGDTKVVERGSGDGLYINTAGIGTVREGLRIGPREVRGGDAVIVSGDLGRHGMAVMAVREGLEFESAIESDSAPLVGPVMDLLDAGVEVHCLRDLTRGGLASALVEIAGASGRSIGVDETAIPVRDDVRAACEILGFDPLYVANEGRFVAFVAPAHVERAIGILRRHPVSAGAVVAGDVGGGGERTAAGATPAGERPLVTLRSRIGALRVIDMLSGEQLPRIC